MNWLESRVNLPTKEEISIELTKIFNSTFEYNFDQDALDRGIFTDAAQKIRDLLDHSRRPS